MVGVHGRSEAPGERSGQTANRTEYAGERSKWWHVPDEDITQLVCTMLEPVAAANGGRIKDGVPDAAWARDALDKLVGERSENEEETEEVERVSSPQATIVRINANPKDPPRRPWHVSDEAIEELVRKLQRDPSSEAASPSQEPSRQSGIPRRGSVGHIDHSRLNRSESIPTGSYSTDCMVVYVYNTETHVNIPLRVTGDTHVGPAATPKGNRFTDFWGRAASTAGFAERRKEFDYRHRVWTDAPQEESRPAWTTSLKSMIEQYTGVPISKQRLTYRGTPLPSDDVTLRSCGLYNGETVLLIRRKEPTRRNDVLLASTQKAEVKKAEAAAERAQEPPKLRLSNALTGVQLVQPKWVHHAGGGKSAFTQVGEEANIVDASLGCDWSATQVWKPYEKDQASATALERIRNSSVYRVAHK